MQLKDYYKTLGVSPTATMQQVKKSFRQLALQHHPDKNPGNAAADTIFKEIQEAYETLIDPAKREEYNYRRWYSRSINEPFAEEPLDPASILNECIRLNNYMQSVNGLRVDFDGLSYHIRQLLSDKNIGILQQFNDETINTRVIEKIIGSAAVLPFAYIPPVAALLLRIAGTNDAFRWQVETFVDQQKQKNNWQKYRTVFVVLVTVLLCWIIYMIGK
jgi:molecular chaperone DnaJ